MAFAHEKPEVNQNTDFLGQPFRLSHAGKTSFLSHSLEQYVMMFEELHCKDKP